MVEVVLEGVRKEFPGTVALRGVDLAVEDGEFFTFVGPSGCGKTTTLRVIAGLESPTDGTVRFGGEDVVGVPPEERDVGIVFQNYALFPHMTVGENVAYGLRFRDAPGGAAPEARVGELLDLVDLPGMEDRDPEELSGGQRQRVALARALAPGPELLLLDEPMSALDARLRKQLRRQVRTIQRELDITTVYVTHDQAEALAISDRVAVMDDGEIEQVGTPREIYRRPASRFVAEFIGENNLFTGTATRADGGEIEVEVDGTAFRIEGEAPIGESVTFCVRPEALSPGADENRFEATVETAEFLGEATRVYADWDGRPVVVRTGDLPDSETVALGFDPAAATVL